MAVASALQRQHPMMALSDDTIGSVGDGHLSALNGLLEAADAVHRGLDAGGAGAEQRTVLAEVIAVARDEDLAQRLQVFPVGRQVRFVIEPALLSPPLDALEAAPVQHPRQPLPVVEVQPRTEEVVEERAPLVGG